MCEVDVNAEVSIKVEDAIDTKYEIPEAISFPPVKKEDEVRLRVCVCVCLLAAQVLRHLLSPKFNCEITLNSFLLS
jgi:hypothetical protein